MVINSYKFLYDLSYRLDRYFGFPFYGESYFYNFLFSKLPRYLGVCRIKLLCYS